MAASSADEIQAVPKWSVPIHNFQDLARVSQVVDQLEQRPENGQLTATLEQFLSPLVSDATQRLTIIQSLINDQAYRQATIQDLISCMDKFQTSLTGLPVELQQEILSHLDITDLRTMYNVNAHLREVLDDKRFIRQLSEVHDIPWRKIVSQIKDQESNQRIFPQWAELYRLYRYDPIVCAEPKNVQTLAICLRQALRQDLVSDVVRLVRLAIEQTVNVRWSDIWVRLLTNYQPVYARLVLDLFDHISSMPDGWRILSSHTKENLFQILPWSSMQYMYQQAIVSNSKWLKLTVVSQIARGLLASNRKVEWTEFGASLSDKSAKNKFVRSSAIFAAELDQADIIRQLLVDYPDNINRYIYTLPAALTDNSLLVEYLARHSNDILYGSLDLALRKNKIDNARIIAQEIIDRDLINQAVQSEIDQDNPLLADIFTKIIRAQTDIGWLVLMLIQSVSTTGLTNITRLNRLLQIAFQNTTSSPLIRNGQIFAQKPNLIQARGIYRYLREREGGVRVDSEINVQRIIANLDELTNNPDQMTPYLLYLNWLSTLPGFNLGRLSMFNIYRNQVIVKLLEYMDNYPYIYEHGTDEFIVSAARTEEDETIHQNVLMTMLNQRVRDPAEHVDLSVVSAIARRITARERAVEMFESIPREQITDEVYLLVRNILSPTITRSPKFFDLDDLDLDELNLHSVPSDDDSSLAASST